MITFDELRKIRHQCASATEVVHFEFCPAYAFWADVVNRYPNSLERELDADYHRMFFEAAEIDKEIIGDALKGGRKALEGLKSDSFVQGYIMGIDPRPGRIEAFTDGYEKAKADALARWQHFVVSKGKFESEVVRGIIDTSSDPEEELRGLYQNAEAIDAKRDGVLFDEFDRLVGLPDIIIKRVDGKPVPYEFKVDKGLSESKTQLIGQILLVNGDREYGSCDTAMLYTLNSGKAEEYKPSSSDVKEFKQTLELLLDAKKEDGVYRGCRNPPVPLYLPSHGMEICGGCEFSARCDPTKIDAIENLGELIVNTNPETGELRAPGARKTVGIEARISEEVMKRYGISDIDYEQMSQMPEEELEKVNERIGRGTAYEQARMFVFPSIREFCSRNNIDIPEESLTSEEMYSNSYTLDRLMLVMEYGFRPTQRMTIGGVAKLLDISDTSVELFAGIADRLGWMYKQKIDSPVTDMPVHFYRRKKPEEMGPEARKFFEKTRSEVMNLMRKCGVPLTTFCAEVCKGMEATAHLDEVKLGITASHSDADKAGGWRRFRTAPR